MGIRALLLETLSDVWQYIMVIVYIHFVFMNYLPDLDITYKCSIQID